MLIEQLIKYMTPIVKFEPVQGFTGLLYSCIVLYMHLLVPTSLDYPV